MKPLLASLVLLLLALCRPSSAADYPDAAKLKAEIDEIKKLVPQAQQDQMKANGEHSLLILDLTTATALMTESLADRLDKKFFDNGVECALKDKALVENVFYGASKTPAQHTAEVAFAKKLGVATCTPAPVDDVGKCFCTDKLPVIVCGAIKYKKEKMSNPPFTATTCPKAAFDSLKAAGPELAKLYDFTKLDKNPNIESIKGILAHKADAVDTITKNGDPVLSQFFCEAIKTDVEKAIKDLGKSDAPYAKAVKAEVDTVLTTEQIKEVAEKCKNAEFKATDFGKCVCADDTFFSFCVYYGLGKEFTKKGFLTDCATTPKFDSANKPKSVELLSKEAEGGSSTDKPGGSPESNLSSPTTSSLLMAPLMAAAALLARR